MNYLIYILLGIVPSIIWLLFYLKKDKNPESKKMILKIFLFGMISTLPTIFLEKGFQILFPYDSTWFFIIIRIFIGIALIEELLKYSIVKFLVFSDSEFDEPTDAPIYMIVSALGFAAFENILILIATSTSFHLMGSFGLIGLRFMGATFLHALASGIFGYFLALSFFYKKNRIRYYTLGLISAVFLHGLFNLSIMKAGGNLQFLIPIVILGISALFLSVAFKRLKKLKSICKLN